MRAVFVRLGAFFLVFSLVAGLCVLLFGVRVEFQCKGMYLFLIIKIKIKIFTVKV